MTNKQKKKINWVKISIIVGVIAAVPALTWPTGIISFVTVENGKLTCVLLLNLRIPPTRISSTFGTVLKFLVTNSKVVILKYNFKAEDVPLNEISLYFSGFTGCKDNRA